MASAAKMSAISLIARSSATDASTTCHAALSPRKPPQTGSTQSGSRLACSRPPLPVPMLHRIELRAVNHHRPLYIHVIYTRRGVYQVLVLAKWESRILLNEPARQIIHAVVLVGALDRPRQQV